MLDGLEGWHIVIIVGIIAVLFGSAKLPAAARSMGQSLRIFKAEMKAGATDDQAAAPTQDAVSSQDPVTPGNPVAPQVIEGTIVSPAATTAAPVADAAPRNVAAPQ
ncbi:MAG TPA: Sec-independent protein translocase subunit TatA [Actinocrinis sp.]|jgi:sec-independent protein translocase protein TatA